MGNEERIYSEEEIKKEMDSILSDYPELEIRDLTEEELHCLRDTAIMNLSGAVYVGGFEDMFTDIYRGALNRRKEKGEIKDC